jgi:MerR family copper efflux transcriptional regulator
MLRASDSGLPTEGVEVPGLDSGLLRIGEVASRAGVSTRTVDFYTGLGLLAPVRRSGGSFRLYEPTDVVRIAAIRRLEAQGLRLEEITHILTASDQDDHTGCPQGDDGKCPADPLALQAYLAAVDVQVLTLRSTAELVDRGTRGVMASLVARAQVLIATAVVLGQELISGSTPLPPL